MPLSTAPFHLAVLISNHLKLFVAYLFVEKFRLFTSQGIIPDKTKKTSSKAPNLDFLEP